jgi:hypothetical protein
MTMASADFTAEYNWCRWFSLSPVVLGLCVIGDVLFIIEGGSIASWRLPHVYITTGALVFIVGGILLFSSRSLWSRRSLRVYAIASLMSVALEMYLRFLAPIAPTGQGDGPVTSALQRLTDPGRVLTGYLVTHEYGTITPDERFVFVGFARKWLIWPLDIHMNALFWALTSAIVIFVYRAVQRKTQRSAPHPEA